MSASASPLTEARLRGLRVLAAAGRARLSTSTELVEALEHHRPIESRRPLSKPIGFVEVALAKRLLDAGLASLEPSGEFIAITEAGHELLRRESRR